MHIQAFFFLSGFGVLVSIYSHVYVSAWLYSSGIIYLSQKLYYLSVSTILHYSLCIFSGGIFIILKNITPYYLFLLTSFIGMLTTLYFGLEFIIHPHSFFVSLTDVWIDNINSRQVRYIEEHITCCGFHKVGEYPKDKCTITFTTSCFPRMVELYSSEIRRGGYTYISMSIIFCLLIAFVFMHGTQKQTIKTPHERIAQIL